MESRYAAVRHVNEQVANVFSSLRCKSRKSNVNTLRGEKETWNWALQEAAREDAERRMYPGKHISS